MTRKINRNGQEIELTAEECRQIWEEQEQEYRLDEVAQEIDNYEDGGDFAPVVADYVRSRIADALKEYNEYIADCLDFGKGLRMAIEDIAEGYKTKEEATEEADAATITRNGHPIMLTAEECEKIYREQQRKYDLEDLREAFDELTENYYWDRFTDDGAVAYFVRDNIEDALTSYRKGTENGLHWSDAARNAVEELAQTITDEDVDRINDCVRKELLYAWETWRNDFKSEAEAQYIREHIDEVIPQCLDYWIADPDESELTLAWNCIIGWSNDNYKEEA